MYYKNTKVVVRVRFSQCVFYCILENVNGEKGPLNVYIQ